MFEQSLMESAGVTRGHRGLVTSLSALAQLTLVVIAILLPMLFTQTPPLLKPHILEQWTPPPVVPPPEPLPTDPSSGHNELTSGTRPIMVNNPFLATQSLAFDRSNPDPEIPQPYGLPGTDPRNLPIANIPGTIIRGPSHPIRISNLSEGRIIRRVTPVYPRIAKTVGLQGQVVLEAVISRAGRIENLHTVSGHPMLAQAAEAAVSQWQFRPYILNGTPVEVVTQITVDFKLNRE
jgi:periplasmic protein TonB